MEHLERAASKIEDALRLLAHCVDEAPDDGRVVHLRHAQSVLVHALDRLRFATEPGDWTDAGDRTR